MFGTGLINLLTDGSTPSAAVQLSTHSAKKKPMKITTFAFSFYFLSPLYLHSILHRRRIKTEDKAKVVASVWGAEFIKFLATPAFLHWDSLTNG